MEKNLLTEVEEKIKKLSELSSQLRKNLEIITNKYNKTTNSLPQRNEIGHSLANTRETRSITEAVVRAERQMYNFSAAGKLRKRKDKLAREYEKCYRELKELKLKKAELSIKKQKSKRSTKEELSGNLKFFLTGIKTSNNL